MNASTSDLKEIESIKHKFLGLTGLRSVEINKEDVGLEHFLRFRVGKNAVIYREVLASIDRELPVDHCYHGRLSLDVTRNWCGLKSGEVEVLRALVNRSLRVTSQNADKPFAVKFVPFRGGEERLIIQPANHAVEGRRGVGKSSLILLAHQKVLEMGHLPVWVDLQPFRSRNDLQVVVAVLNEVLYGMSLRLTGQMAASAHLEEALQKSNWLRDKGEALTEAELRKSIPDIQRAIRQMTTVLGKNVYIFLDDAHLLEEGLQPLTFEVVFSVLKGAGGWLKIAGVRNLLRLYDPSSKMGLQHPNDIQLISLDLTLTDPHAAREHLTGILDAFLGTCGIERRGSLVRQAAIDRLVWCSAGVPRDFLLLLERSISIGLEARRNIVGVQDVNMAVGEFGQQKMRELDEDSSTEGQKLRNSLELLEKAVLEEARSNAFLVKQDTRHPGYSNLQKLVDLRLVHLIHSSITPGRSGDRYEAYLLDYSFYTGMRRRHGLKVLSITPELAPRYAELRGLAKISPERLSQE